MMLNKMFTCALEIMRNLASALICLSGKKKFEKIGYTKKLSECLMETFLISAEEHVPHFETKGMGCNQCWSDIQANAWYQQLIAINSGIEEPLVNQIRYTIQMLICGGGYVKASEFF